MSDALVIEVVRKTVTVDCAVEEAFRIFTADALSWWPVESHSIHETVSEIVFEPKAGGEVYELSASGEKGHWATVLEWEPPGTARAGVERPAARRPRRPRSRCASSPTATERASSSSTAAGSCSPRRARRSARATTLAGTSFSASTSIGRTGPERPTSIGSAGGPCRISSRRRSGRRRGAKIVSAASSSSSVHQRIAVMPSALSSSHDEARCGLERRGADEVDALRLAVPCDRRRAERARCASRRAGRARTPRGPSPRGARA